MRLSAADLPFGERTFYNGAKMPNGLSPDLVDPRFFDHLGEIPGDLFHDTNYWSVEWVERYGREWALTLAQRLDLTTHLDGEARSPAQVLDALGGQAKYSPALSWLFERLAQDGFVNRLLRDGDPVFRITSELREPELEAVREAAIETDPGNAAFLDLLDLAGDIFPQVIAGEIQGEKALLGMGQTSLWLRYFHNDNPVYALNNRIAAAAAAHRLPADDGVSILEVGAGAGSAAGALLGSIEADGSLARIGRYQLSDPAAFFLRRGARDLAERFSTVAVETSGLDVNGDWESQGVEPGSAGMVYGVNVFHVAHDLQHTLTQTHRALAPSGWVIIGECLRPKKDFAITAEMIFLLLDGFLEVDLDADLRPNPGFLTADEWRANLESAGFETIETAPDIEGVAQYYPRFTTGAICARKRSS